MALGFIALSLAARPLTHDSVFKARIPFAFAIGAQTLPAGTYVVEIPLGGNEKKGGTGVLVIRTLDGRIYKTLITSLKPARQNSRGSASTLFFTSTQNRNYLEQVRLAGAKVIYQLMQVPDQPTPATASVSEVKLTGID